MVRLFVRDNLSGDVHEYGDDSHDSLILSEDGSLHYYNLHNGTGTMFSEEGYSFCLADGSDPRLCEDYIEYGVEPYINIGGETMNDDFTTEYTMNIVNKVEETESDFIFETITPYCENALQIEISKNDLVKALQHYTQRAKWINNEGCIPECSNCHYSTPYDYSIDDYEYGNYCPNCGAKMEGGKNGG